MLPTKKLPLLPAIFPLLIICSIPVHNLFSQTAEQTLRGINNYDDMKAFMDKNSQINCWPFQLNSAQDSSAIQKQLLTHKKGDIFSIGKRMYKVISDTMQMYSRATYIYIDGTKFNKPQIDSLRQLVLSQYYSGVPFSDLVTRFNMDGSLTGETSWFPDNMMVPEFTNAVKNHSYGEVFTVDVPANSWYYVVLKSHNSKRAKEMVLFCLDN